MLICQAMSVCRKSNRISTQTLGLEGKGLQGHCKNKLPLENRFPPSFQFVTWLPLLGLFLGQRNHARFYCSHAVRLWVPFCLFYVLVKSQTVSQNVESQCMFHSVFFFCNKPCIACNLPNLIGCMEHLFFQNLQCNKMCCTGVARKVELSSTLCNVARQVATREISSATC